MIAGSVRVPLQMIASATFIPAALATATRFSVVEVHIHS